MPSLGELFYSLSIRDTTDADLQKISAKLRNLGFDITLTPKILRDITQAAVPKGVKIELDPTITDSAVAKAVEGKTMRIAVTPLLTGFREAIAKATRENPPTAEVGVSEARLRSVIQNVLNRQGFMLNISTVNDNYVKAVQAKLNGATYTVKIHADARAIAQSVQASLMQVQSRSFGLKVNKDILYRSIDEALGQKRFNINIAVSHGQARQAVRAALLRAQVIGKDQALAYQRLMSGEAKAAQAELLRLKAAQHGAAEAAKAHASASINLGGALGSNIKIAGELGSVMGSLYSVHAAKQFLAQVVEVGGELEHQKIAMNTIFGDEGKTNELFGKIKTLARESPFGVMELSKSVKALSAYGVEYNAIYDTAKRLADISTATSVDINRLILAFGKTKSRGFLDGLEAKQFAYANIPIYEMVRKKLEELEGQAVTTADVMARMKKGEISFDIVQSVLWDITDPGGKFYDMQMALAGSVKTSWKLVRDNIELMFGDIAESWVGGALKDTAEILQGLTQKWRTVGAVVAAAAAMLGIHKVATAAVNSTMQKSTAVLYNNIMAQKKKSAEELKAWGRITQLTNAEKMRIATANKLTNADLRAALAEETLTDKHIAQLFWQKKITAEQVKYLANIGLLDPAMSKAILNTNRFALSWQYVKAAAASAGKAVYGFLMNPWTIAFAAISAGISAWQSYSRQMKKAEELSENLFTKADDGAKNLKATLEDIKPSGGLEDIQLERGIETLEQALKDYSPTPIADINDALVAQDGHVRSLAERYEVLRGKVESVADAYDAIRSGKDSELLEYSVKKTGGVINDTVVENAKDYSERLKAHNSAVTDYAKEKTATIQDLVQRAKKSSAEFAKVAETLGTTEAQFKELINGNYFNAQDGLYWELETGAKQTIGEKSRSGFWLFGQTLAEAKSAFEKDVKQQIKEITAWIETEWGTSVENLSKNQKQKLSIALKSMLDGAEGTSDEVKSKWAAMLEDAFGIQIMEDKIGPALQSVFRDMMGEGMKEGAKDASLYREVAAVLQTEGYTKLSKARKDLADKVMGEAKARVMSNLGIMTEEMQNYLANNPLSQIITLTYQDGTQNQLQKEIIQKRGVMGYYGRTKSYVDNWTKSGKIDKARSEAQSQGKALKKTLSEAKKAGVGIESAQKAWDEYRAAIDYLGWGDLKLSDSSKDKFAEQLKQRLKDIKDAWSEFQKWSKTEGREAAAKRIGESGLFSTLPTEQIPQTVEQYRALVDGLENELRQAGVKGSARENLLNELLKQKFDIDKTVVDEQIKLSLGKVNKTAERQLADWNLYDKVRTATGNEELAMSIGFGLNADADTDYVGMIKKQFAAVADQYDNMKGLTYDMVKDESYLADAPEDVRKAWEKANSEILKYFDSQRDAVADILAEYQTLQDQLAKIDFNRDEKKKKVQSAENLTPEQKERLTQRIDAAADYDKFTKSAEYLRFFSDIYALSLSEAGRIGDLIQQNLNRKLQSGLITLIDYEKEMSKVRKQLDAMRNVKSDSMAFLTGGLKGLYSQKLQKEEAKLGVNDDYQKALAQQVAAQEALNRAQKSGNEAAIAAAKEQLNAANKAVAQFTKQRDWLANVLQMMERISAVTSIVSGIAQGLSSAFNSIKDAAEALGADTESSGWLDVGGVIDTLASVTSGVDNIVKSAMSGSVSGVIGGVISAPISTITSPIAIWAKIHDKKLQKQIEQSQQQVKLLQNLSSLISSRMKYYLGNARNMEVSEVEKDKQKAEYYSKRASRPKGHTIYELIRGKDQANADKYQARVDAYETGGAYGYQRQLMHEEIDELEKQRQAELDKKDTDSGAVAEYEKQIEELKIQIMQFAEDTANSLYGIDIKGWASEFGDALFQAWQQGEDGAKAFEKTAGDIIGKLMNNILTVGMIEPMFKDLQTYLFGTDGESGAFGSDFELTPDEVDGMAQRIMKGMEGVDAYNSALEQLEKVLNEKYGITMKEESSGGLSAGIQGVTEDTADLLASYINAIRADVSEQTHTLWPRLLDDMLPQMNAIAESQLREQKKIAANTLRNAVAAEQIAESTDTINGLLTRVTQGGAKFYVQ